MVSSLMQTKEFTRDNLGDCFVAAPSGSRDGYTGGVVGTTPLPNISVSFGKFCFIR